MFSAVRGAEHIVERSSPGGGDGSFSAVRGAESIHHPPCPGAAHRAAPDLGLVALLRFLPWCCMRRGVARATPQAKSLIRGAVPGLGSQPLLYRRSHCMERRRSPPRISCAAASQCIDCAPSSRQKGLPSRLPCRGGPLPKSRLCGWPPLWKRVLVWSCVGLGPFCLRRGERSA